MSVLRLSAEERGFLQAQRVARLATVDAAGQPHVIPICFAFHGKRIYSPLDEKPKRVPPERLARVRNIRAHPLVAVVMDRYDEDWARLGWLLLRGKAEVLRRGAEHRRAVELLRARYPQYRAHRLEGRPILRITVASATSWGRL